VAYSAITLVKLQRLARAAKKNLNLITQLSSEADIFTLVSRASMEHDNASIVALFEDFKATLTAEDREILSESGAIESSASMQDGAAEEILHDRVYRGVVIHDDASGDEGQTETAEPSAMKTAVHKQRMYRGVVIEEDAEALIETAKQAEMKAESQAQIQSELDAQVKLKMTELEKEKAQQNLIKFPKDVAAPAVKSMRKQIGTYRGQPVYEEE